MHERGRSIQKRDLFVFTFSENYRELTIKFLRLLKFGLCRSKFCTTRLFSFCMVAFFLRIFLLISGVIQGTEETERLVFEGICLLIKCKTATRHVIGRPVIHPVMFSFTIMKFNWDSTLIVIYFYKR